MNRPFISIIIPVYNDEPYIARAIESCINQTFRNIEIVIVDDASTDKTPDIIAEYAKKDDRISVLRHSRNKKTLQAIKKGVLAANGSYIMVVSGDDTFDLDAVETCVETINENPDVDIVQFGRRVVGRDGAITNTLVPTTGISKGAEILKNLFSLTKGSQGSFSNKCWKRTLLTKVFRRVTPTKPLVLGEDQVVVFLLALQAKKYIAISKIIHNYYFGIGMDGRDDIDLDYFLHYRMNMADSMDELERQLKAMEVADWVWEHFVALKREHYAWSVFFTTHLNDKDRFTALRAWTERTNAVDTLIGVANYIPDRFLDEYLDFLVKYQPDGFDMRMCREIIGSMQKNFSIRATNKDAELNELKGRNAYLSTELASHLGIKRSAKLTLGNVSRRLKYGKNR